MKKILVLLIVCFACIILPAQQLHWTPVSEGLYSGSTTVIAVVQINGVEQASAQMELAAFSGEECRGTAFTTEFPITHRFLAMVNVYGEIGHELTFKAYNHATQEELEMNPVVTVTFTEDGSGTLFEPLELNFRQQVVVENIDFADANVKALCVANWDTNDDGELSYAEAAAVTSLGTVFKQNNNITSFDELQYFTGLTEIGYEAFAWCMNLLSIQLPSTITSIGGEAFYDCRSLLSITIPAAVTSIGSSALSCDNLETIVVEDGNTVYDSRDNCNAVILTNANAIIRGCKNTVIPNTVVTLGPNAFSSCTMTSVYIPASVGNISNNTFYDCENLSEITVDVSNEMFDSRNNCNAIIETSTNKLITGSKTTVIPNSVTAIDDYAFSYRFIDGSYHLTIPESILSIGHDAYLGGFAIDTITVLAHVPPALGDEAFEYVPKDIPVYVPHGTLAAYQAAPGWSEFTNIQENASGNITFADANVKALCVANWDTNGDGELSYAEAAAVTDLGEVFRGNSNITSFDELQYFTGLTSINNYAFMDCWKLTTLTIPNTVTSIGNMAFADCYKLALITIPNTVTSIGNSAFFGACITSITIPASVSSIGNEAFGYCSSLAQIVVETGNTSFDSRNNCNAIIRTGANTLIAGCKNTTIPNTVTVIESNAFYGCDSLNSITIPSSVSTIGNGAFGHCSSLTQILVETGNMVFDSRDNCNAIINTSNNSLVVGCKNTTIPSTVSSIGGYAFYHCSGLTTITIPASVTTIMTAAFLSCVNLTSMTVLSETPPVLGNAVFVNVNKTIPVYILCGSLSAYQNAGGWSEFTNYQELECPSYEITVTANPTNGGTITGNGTYTQGATCTLTATANTGYTFVNWTENGTQVSTNAEYSFVVMGDRNLVTNFEEINGNGNLNGVFSVGENATVSFSQGNLQYQASTNTWRFATNQWDYIGEDNANVSATYNGWIDLFGWGTSGYNHGAVCYQPWNTSTTYSDYYAYGSGNYNLYDQTGTADWGYNAISNGGNQENSGWRTLTKEEWSYLFDTRITASSIRYAKAELNGVNGVILLPDDWNADYYVLNNTNERDADYSSNIISATQWDTLILHGAVFLPTAGIRDGTSVNYVGSDGFYWSASYYYNGVNSGATWYVCFYASGLWLNGDYGRYCGKSVRLVRSAQNYSYSITVTANPTEGGMVSGGGTYAEGAECTLTATANDGFVFVSWTENGEPVSTNATYSFEVNGARNLVANFALQGTITNHWIPIQTFENTMDGIGIVLIDGVEQQSAALELGIFCGDECRGAVLPEEESGHWFYYFTMGGNQGESFSFRLYDHAANQELDLVCNETIPFEINGFIGDFEDPHEFLFSNNVTIAVQVNPDGAGVVTGTGDWPLGSSVTLTATANEGFAFLNWTIGDEVVSTETSLTITAEASMDIVANFNYVQSWSLQTGWTWWSTYIELSNITGLSMLEEALGDAGVMIKTKNAYARVNASHTWYGSLKSINNETGYKIQTSAACDIDMTGTLATSGDHPITIGNGWNWIGYPVMTTQSPNAALTGFQPENKDVIKGQSGYARYDSNSGTWKPASFTLVPGRSYLYYSNATESKSMTFVTGRNERSVETEECHWTGDVHAFPDNNCILAIVKVDGVEQRDNALELGAFVDGQCRGSVRLMHDDDYDRYFAMLTVTAQDGEEIHFGVFDHQSGEASMNCVTRMTFESDAIIGDFTSPFEINLTTRRNENANMSVYPNPMDRNQKFSIQLPEGEQATGVTITDVTGALFRCEMGGINVTMIDGFQTAGVYVVRVTCTSGNVYYHKLVVK